MDGGSGDEEPWPIKRRSETERDRDTRRLEENASRGCRRGLGRHPRREACPPIPLFVDGRRCRRRRLIAHNARRGWRGKLRLWRGDVENETPGADFSSIRDDDGTALVYYGMGKQALGFLLAQSSRAKE